LKAVFFVGKKKKKINGSWKGAAAVQEKEEKKGAVTKR